MSESIYTINDFIRDLSFDSRVSLMATSEIFEYLREEPLALFEFNRGGYFLFKTEEFGYIFINSNDVWAFWSRSMQDIVDVLILLSKKHFAIIHPECYLGDVCYLLFDDLESYFYADELIDICYSESAKILRVNKFIIENGYSPLDLEIHY